MSSKSSSSSKSFIAMRTRRRGRVVHEKKKSDFRPLRKKRRSLFVGVQSTFHRIVYIQIFPVSNSLSHQKGISKRRQNTREKDASSISYRHDVSFALVHEFDRHAHAFPVETDVIVGAHDDRPTNSFLTTIKKRRRSKKNAFKRRRRFFLYCLGFVSLGFVSSEGLDEHDKLCRIN